MSLAPQILALEMENKKARLALAIVAWLDSRSPQIFRQETGIRVSTGVMSGYGATVSEAVRGVMRKERHPDV